MKNLVNMRMYPRKRLDNSITQNVRLKSNYIKKNNNNNWHLKCSTCINKEQAVGIYNYPIKVNVTE